MNRERLKRTNFQIWHYTKKVMGQVFHLIMKYPNTAIGIILALVIGLMLLSIPLAGPWLFVIVEPFLLIAFIVMFGSRDYGRS